MKLGVSVYPHHSSAARDKEYLSLAAKYGFRRVFTCLLSVQQPALAIQETLKDVVMHANSLDMEVVLDIAPQVFADLGIDYNDLSWFTEIGAAGLRLDEGCDGFREAMLTYNQEGLKIELNASLGAHHFCHVLACKPDRTRLVACHNFYPQRYTGLSFQHFTECNRDIHQLGIPIAAFIGSQAPGTFGPWPLHEGLCTLEMHRNLPIDVQARHLSAIGTIDTAIIANAYATEHELADLSRIASGKVMLGIQLCEDVTETEQNIIFNFPHLVRGDLSEYMARSTFPRLTYKDVGIPPHATARVFERGDVVILNDLYSRYKGELQIILKEMPNDGRKNLVGKIPHNEIFLLDYLTSWEKFSFCKR